MRYQYRCSRCKHSEERNVPVAERDRQYCMNVAQGRALMTGENAVQHCERKMTRQFDPSSLTITVPEGFKQNLGFSLTEPANDEVRKTWEADGVTASRWI